MIITMAQFKEIARTTVSEKRDIVVSSVTDNGEVTGYNFNSYIRTEKYTGFTAGGCFVPVEKVQDFKNLANKI